MTIKIYSHLRAKGFIMLPYGLIRTIGEIYAIVLMELLAELNYADNNYLNRDDDFLCNLGRLSEILNIKQDCLLEILQDLEKNNFIAVFSSDIEDIKYIRINQDNIINYIETNDKNGFMNWDDGLKMSLNPTNKTLSFNESTQKIKDYLDNHLKTPNAIPLILYSFFNDVIKQYEECFGNIFNNIDVRDWLEDLVLKPDREDEKNSSRGARCGFAAMTETLNNKVLNYTNANNQK